MALFGVIAGCGPQAGTFLYFFGQPPKQTTKAQFKLTKGPLLILFDDSPAVDMPPEFREVTIRRMTDLFRQVGINDKVVAPARLNQIRQENRDFDKKGIREIGRMAKAEQVLWLHPKEFALPTAPEQALDPGRVSVVLKVINANAEERGDLRLWPVSEEGELVSMTFAPARMRDAKTEQERIELMADNLAAKISRLFYDYDAARPEDGRQLGDD